ncbi:MAG TPA: winged helix-turn-helix domain-containing protein [Burkholderiaceae bacterium]|nr:winged helix-turn-helix domain-containing protein [Burkholderiaceae bacterium]
MGTAYQFGNAELRPDQRLLLVGGKDSRIGARAFDLLLALVERRHRIVSKNELLDSIWPGVVVEENNLQVQVSSLRKVLGPQTISTIPGRGYRFTAALDGAAVAPAPGSTRSPTPADAGALCLTNLPAQLPTLYGRADDLAALRTSIESHTLVTIVGVGGIGKSALAQALAHRLRGSFDEGVWMVELAPVADPSLVASTVASALRIVLGAQAPIETLAKALSASRMLIVLDSCEHLLDAVAELATALHRTAPNVRLLATSQESLKVPQEQLHRLGGLALPSDESIASARQAGAVALFEARAHAADPRFALSEHNVAAVVDICRHLDGIALAIELAAARVPLLGVDGLRARLHDRFRVLTGGARLALRRHQTLRAALDWSHGLLMPDEQTVFRRLGVFAGSFGLDSAQRVVADERIDPWAALDHLGALVDKSLLVAEAGDEPRYRLLETSRAFALEKLQQADETEIAMRRHCEAMVAVFEESRRVEHVLAWQALMDRYLPDLDNARAALDWAAGPGGDAQLQIALAGVLGWVWYVTGLLPEGQRRIASAIARIDAATPPEREAPLLASWSRVSQEFGPRELAADTRAVALYRALGDRQGLFLALCAMGLRLAMQDDQAGAERAMREAEQIFEASWPPAMRSRLLKARAWSLNQQGRFAEGIALYEELHQLATALGDKQQALVALIGQEQGVAALGRLQESVQRGRDMRELLRQDPSLRPCNEIFVLSNLFMSLTEVGEVDEALEVARLAQPLLGQTGNSLCMLDPLARLAFQRGHLDHAARILGRAEMRYATTHHKRQWVETQLHDKLILGLRQALPADELARLMKEGEALSDDDAASLALRGDEDGGAATPP